MSDPMEVEKKVTDFPQKTLRRRKIILWTGVIALAVAVVTVLCRVLSAIQSLTFANNHTAVMLALHFTKRKPTAPPVDTTKTPGNVVNTWVGGPVIATNFADPSFIEVNGVYYAFATNRYVSPRGGQVNIQVAVSNDFSTWNLTGKDALPNVGPWSAGTFTWAPDVVQLVRRSLADRFGSS